jgi:Ca-activated chloride channel family protein
MNSHFPNSPEDKLLDELLREQSHGPDEAFLKQLEAAVDAGSSKAVKRPPAYGKFSIAAGLALAAGVGLWSYSENRKSPDQTVAVLEKMSVRESDLERTEIVPGGHLPAHSPIVNQAEAIAANEGKISAPVDLPAAEPLPAPPSLAVVDESQISRGLRSSDGALGGAGGGKGFGFGSGSGGGISEELKRFDKSRDFAGTDAAKPAASRMFGLVPHKEAAPDSISNDRYGTFIDQPWKSPDKDPLSTFSIDVDTASYSNVRRMIVEGRQIPKDAVRIEECINAFSYNYAQPKGDGPFAVGATLAVCPWNPSHQLVRVAIKGREIEANKRPASNLVFLIDVSGSMQSSDKLPLLKQSMATMVEQLDERDRVAIVVYAGTEGVALPSTRLDAAGKATVLKSLEKLEAGGSTNGGAGIKRAYELAMKEKVEGGVNRVILATDGDFNVGVTGQPALVELVKERAKSGVYLTVVGFGTGNLNDAMMDAITHDGNGNYFYIDSDREGRKVFLQNLSGTLVTIAKDVKIQVEFNPAKVGSYRLIGYANRVLKNEDFNNDKVDAGDIGAGHTVTAFYELMPPGKGAGTDELKYQASAEKPAASADWLTVKLRHKHPEGDESSKIEFPLTGEVQALDKTEPDFQFATAVALFGMKLRNMEEVRDFGWDKVIALATPGLANDATDDRAEFVGLVKKLAGTVKVLPEPAEIAPGIR